MSVVIKYGGNAMTEPSVRRSVAAAIRQAADRNERPVVVHGGGPFIEEELSRAGIQASFSRGMRVTSEEAIVHVERALTMLGKLLAQEIGGAVGLTGRDAGLIEAALMAPELGRVGRVTRVDGHLLERLLDAGVVPVLACLALDEQGEPLNVNADLVAGAVAASLKAPVVFLTNVPGVLADPGDPSSLIPVLNPGEVRQRIADGRIAGGMIPKVEAALAALELGATSAVIADGMAPRGLERALQGAGGTRLVTK